MNRPLFHDTIRLRVRSASGASLRLAPLVLALAAGTGCYRATGLARPTSTAEVIPAAGGDRVAGIKASAGPGDYYVGNDFVALAVDGAALGHGTGQFHDPANPDPSHRVWAPSGGAILDLGGISLDNQFKRVPVPSDNLERLGPVVNQDPALPLAFDRFAQKVVDETAHLEMQGYVMDPQGKLGVATDADGRVLGAEVVHTITLGKTDRYFEVTTTVTNRSGHALPIRSIGDFLHQRGGGVKFMVPATAEPDSAHPGQYLPLNYSRKPWGVQIPGTDFAAPLDNSVKAPMVAFMGTESSAPSTDMHQSFSVQPRSLALGTQALSADEVVVASDPQDALGLGNPRTPDQQNPARLVVGSVPVASLADGQSLTWRRRIYQVFGSSSDNFVRPPQASSLSNQLALDRSKDQSLNYGSVGFNTYGTAAPSALPTEFRFERYLPGDPQGADPATDSDPTHWKLERIDWLEPSEAAVATNRVAGLLPAISADAAHGATAPWSGHNFLYRIVARNRNSAGAVLSSTRFLNTLEETDRDLPQVLEPQTNTAFEVADYMAPERDLVTDPATGIRTGHLVVSHAFSVFPGNRGTGSYSFQPYRLAFSGQGSTPDPDLRRQKRTASHFDTLLRGKWVSGGRDTEGGAYTYSGGNQLFGVNLLYNSFTSSAGYVQTFTVDLPLGTYQVYGAQGPLSRLTTDNLQVEVAGDATAHTYYAFVQGLPAAWTSFDLPGPTQMTTGGYDPMEVLSSALAEQVDVVARTEQDVQTDPAALQSDFRMEFNLNRWTTTNPNYSPADPIIGPRPFVLNARTSSLQDGGATATALSTPVDASQPRGGARPSQAWTLADFLAQAEGQYAVLHRPVSFFAAKGFDPNAALGSGANAWWTATGSQSLGKREGDFDALELLRGESLAGSDPGTWFSGYTAARGLWFQLLNLQTPARFTKGLGVSMAKYSQLTPVGLARTYLKTPIANLAQDKLDPVLQALRSGAAVASTGPLLDVTVHGTGEGPGQTVKPSAGPVTLDINLYAPSWMPLGDASQRLRVYVNGAVVLTRTLADFSAPSASDDRLRTLQVNVPVTQDGWISVEFAPADGTTGYLGGSAKTPWNALMKGIYPVAVTNPIFVDLGNDGYHPPKP